MSVPGSNDLTDSVCLSAMLVMFMQYIIPIQYIYQFLVFSFFRQGSKIEQIDLDPLTPISPQKTLPDSQCFTNASLLLLYCMQSWTVHLLFNLYSVSPAHSSPVQRNLQNLARQKKTGIQIQTSPIHLPQRLSM